MSGTDSEDNYNYSDYDSEPEDSGPDEYDYEPDETEDNYYEPEPDETEGEPDNTLNQSECIYCTDSVFSLPHTCGATEMCKDKNSLDINCNCIWHKQLKDYKL